jgi:GDP-4-dehydro-6-deoxy-D-mannose reductase
MRALVTGSTGFIGQHLVRHLAREGYEVWAAVRDERKAAALKADEVVKCDIRRSRQVDSMVAASKPDVIYHLAAQSNPTKSWDDPKLTLETNVVGTANLFEAVLKAGLDPLVVVACSSAEYGFVREAEVPVKENHSLQPLHPYGVSKVAQDLLTYQYFKNNGLRGVRARIFNTTGPGKKKDVVSDLARRIVECERGASEGIVHGNLAARRDLTDVRDMVRALHSCERAVPGEAYNLCSMKAYPISDLLDTLMAMADGYFPRLPDPKLMRPTDEPVIMGDNTKFRRKTGWKPKIKIEQTLRDTLKHWRQAKG